MDDEIPLQGGSHASSSHETSLEPTTKRREDLGKHNVHTHFPKRQLRISKQSPIRSRGAGSSYSMDPGVSVQKQNFTRNPEKLAKVPGTREEF